jgi:predicted protein tyrosine phosphatase
MNLLFVCTAHINRSVTAEQLFRSSKKHRAKSAGIGFLSDIRVNEKLVKWADMIFVMDEKNEGQKSFLLKKFQHVRGIREKVHVLGIQDEYRKNSPELVTQLQTKLKKYF